MTQFSWLFSWSQRNTETLYHTCTHRKKRRWGGNFWCCSIICKNICMLCGVNPTKNTFALTKYHENWQNGKNHEKWTIWNIFAQYCVLCGVIRNQILVLLHRAVSSDHVFVLSPTSFCLGGKFDQHHDQQNILSCKRKVYRLQTTRATDTENGTRILKIHPTIIPKTMKWIFSIRYKTSKNKT